MTVKLGELLLDGRMPRIAVPFRDKVDASRIAEARRLGMDIAELRIDLFSSHDCAYVSERIGRFAGIPILATIRSRPEGGTWDGTETQRRALFEAILPEVDAVDIELSSSSILSAVVAAARERGKCAIVSFHDFEKTPALETLESIVDGAKSSGADIVKIAALCSSPEDIHTLTRLTTAHQDKGLVTIGMGDAGILTRILFPALGSLFTFASFGEGTATGQISLGETVHYLRTFYPQYRSAPGV